MSNGKKFNVHIIQYHSCTDIYRKNIENSNELDLLTEQNYFQLETAYYSDKQAQKHTEILKKPLMRMRLRIIANIDVINFTRQPQNL